VVEVDRKAKLAKIAFAPDVFAEAHLKDVEWARKPQPKRRPRPVKKIDLVFAVGDVARFSPVAWDASQAEPPEHPEEALPLVASAHEDLAIRFLFGRLAWQRMRTPVDVGLFRPSLGSGVELAPGRFERSGRLFAELAQESRSALVLRLRLVLSIGSSKETDQACARLFVDWVDAHECSREWQRSTWVGSESGDQRTQNIDVETSRVFPLCSAPRCELVEVDEIEPLEELAFENGLERDQALRGNRIHARSQLFSNASPVEGSLVQSEFDAFPVSEERSLALGINHRPDLRQAPS